VSNIDNTLSNGLASISDQLRPLRELDRLRDLTTQRTRVEREPADRLENLREALKRPKWTDAGSLSVREEPVRFIGGNYVPSPRPAIQGLEYRAAPFFESARFSEWPVHATEELQVISGRVDLLLDDGGDFAIIDHKSFPGSMELDIERLRDDAAISVCTSAGLKGYLSARPPNVYRSCVP
jgi:hypothetical protein